jgi:hypothetical protein
MPNTRLDHAMTPSSRGYHLRILETELEVLGATEGEVLYLTGMP